jgi:MFS family permease
MSIISMLMYSGLYVIIPFLFEKEDKGLIDIFYTIIAEVPVAIIVVLLIDRVGRLPLILVGISLSIVFAFIIWHWRIRHLLIGFIAFRFFNRMTFISISPLVVESYSTVYRSLGIGTTTAVGRVGGFVSSAIFFPLYNKDNYIPFFFSMLLFMILFFIFATFPRDLTNKPLDLRYDEEKKKDE